MDERLARTIANLQSFDDIRQFESNVRRRDAFTDDISRALDARSGDLGRAIVAEQTGLDLTNLSPAEERIVRAAAIYAGLKKRAGSHAGRMFQQFRNRGLIGAAEASVSKSKPTIGFETLASENLAELSFETIILEHPEEFSDRAIWYSRRTLGLANETEKPPVEGASRIQRRTEELVSWLQARSETNGGVMPPYTNAEAAAALGMDDMHRYGRVHGNIQSRLDYACYLANLPPLGLSATSPFEDAWRQQDRSWAFPIDHMREAAQSRGWSAEDFETILDRASTLPGQAHIVWKAELSGHETKVRDWAFGSFDGNTAESISNANSQTRQRNPKWSRDELILALDLYIRVRETAIPKNSEEIAELSDFLGHMARRLGRTQSATFRNAAGVYMKLMNFRRLDPGYTREGRVGLARGNNDEEPVWRIYAADPALLAREAASIRARFADGVEGSTVTANDQDAPYWVFVCNPKKWAIDEFLARGITRDSWGIRPSDRAHFAPGQLGIVRVGVDRRSTQERDGRPPLAAGIYALCEVESEAFEGSGANDGFWSPGSEREPGWPTVRIRYLRTYGDTPLTIENLRERLPHLSPLLLNGFQAASFPLPAEDFRTIMELMGEDLDALAADLPENPTADALAALQDKYKNASPEVKERLSRYIERGEVGALVKKANGYKCQVCEALGLHPFGFKMKNGDFYVEAHHVMPVAKKEVGSLAASNIMTVCANHHRQLHYGGVQVAIGTTTFDMTFDDVAINIARHI